LERISRNYHFTVTDPEGASATTKANFTVFAVNEAPDAVSAATS
jgi:hypothetical protein